MKSLLELSRLLNLFLVVSELGNQETVAPRQLAPVKSRTETTRPTYCICRYTVQDLAASEAPGERDFLQYPGLLRQNLDLEDLACKSSQGKQTDLIFLDFSKAFDKMNPKVREMAYKTLVCPQLEYAFTIWDPHTNENTYKIEMVQRCAACWTMNDYARTTSITSLLQQLGWQTLEERRMWLVFVSSTKL